jgi:hypothetical protein
MASSRTTKASNERKENDSDPQCPRVYLTLVVSARHPSGEAQFRFQTDIHRSRRSQPSVGGGHHCCTRKCQEWSLVCVSSYWQLWRGTPGPIKSPVAGYPDRFCEPKLSLSKNWTKIDQFDVSERVTVTVRLVERMFCPNRVRSL